VSSIVGTEVTIDIPEYAIDSTTSIASPFYEFADLFLDKFDDSDDSSKPYQVPYGWNAEPYDQCAAAFSYTATSSIGHSITEVTFN
jgi:hypothetical protein